MARFDLKGDRLAVNGLAEPFEKADRARLRLGRSRREFQGLREIQVCSDEYRSGNRAAFNSKRHELTGRITGSAVDVIQFLMKAERQVFAAHCVFSCARVCHE